MEEKLLNDVFNVVRKGNSEDVTKINIRISENGVRVSFKKKKNFLKNFVEKIKKIFEEKGTTMYVLDTCALCSNEAMKIIKEAKKVVLTNGVICEMDKYKKAKGSFGNNVSTILKQSALDQKQEKFICVQEEIVSDYNDDNLINYCKKIKRRAILLTADNDLANKAKVHNIKYIHFESKEKNDKKVNGEEKVQEQETKVDSEQKDNKKAFFNRPAELKPLLSKDNNGWILKARNTPYVREMVVRNNQLLAKEVEQYHSENVRLEDKDMIYKIVKSQGKITVCIFEMNDSTGIEKIKEMNLSTINELYREIQLEDLADIIKSFLTVQYN